MRLYKELKKILQQCGINRSKSSRTKEGKAVNWHFVKSSVGLKSKNGKEYTNEPFKPLLVITTGT